MTLEPSTALAFLQLIVLAFTALIYIGQSTLKIGETESDTEAQETTRNVTAPASIILLGAISMAVSGVATAIYLIPTVAGKHLMLLQFWVVDVPLLSPWIVPPLFLFSICLFLLYWLVQRPLSGVRWVGSVTVVLAAGTFGAAGASISYYSWLPLLATSTFALGMSLFLAGLVALTWIVTQNR